MNKLVSSFVKSLSTTQSMYTYHFPNGSVYNSVMFDPIIAFCNS
jgi:hypothetical protein